MKRRRLLQLLALVVGAIVAALMAWRPSSLVSRIATAFGPRLDLSSPTGTLSPAELATVVAFGEILVDGGTLPPLERGYLVEHIDDRTRRIPGLLALYRTTAELLDGLAGAPFATLGTDERARLMTDHRLTVAEVTTWELLVPFSRRQLTVRAMAVPDLLLGFYASPAGWAVVGYDTFPGRCGDLTRYTRPEA
jgi:hypothetical protein